MENENGCLLAIGIVLLIVGFGICGLWLDMLEDVRATPTPILLLPKGA